MTTETARNQAILLSEIAKKFPQPCQNLEWDNILKSEVVFITALFGYWTLLAKAVSITLHPRFYQETDVTTFCAPNRISLLAAGN